MASMKASIERAAELLDIPADALTEYVLNRDPNNAPAAVRTGEAIAAARSLDLSPTELLLAVIGMVRAQDASAALDAIHVALAHPDMSAGQKLGSIAAVLANTGRAV